MESRVFPLALSMFPTTVVPTTLSSSSQAIRSGNMAILWAGNANGTSGAYLQTGSTNNTGGGNWLRMGVGAGSFGSYILNGGAVRVGGRTQIGENGVGYVEINGGTYNGNVNDGGANPAMVCGQGDSGPAPALW